MNNVEPIMVVFEDKDEKDQLWSKLSMKIVDDIVKRRSSIAITNVSFLSVATMNYKLGRGGVLGQRKGTGSWVKKQSMGILAVTGYGSI